MLRLIPAPLHRAGLASAHRLRQLWWRWRRPLLQGCRVLAFDEAGRVLMVRHSYGSGRWMLPGGGIARGEEPLAAGRRELAEEVGCALAGACQIGTVDEPLGGATNRVHLVCGRAIGVPKPDGREILVAQFHDPEELPADMAAVLVAGLPDWIRAAEAALLPLVD